MPLSVASSNASLKIWLSMQCQMLGNASAGMLVQTSSSKPLIVAKWPQGIVLDANLRDVLAQVREKGRLHLAPQGQQLILGQPLEIDGQVWGILVVRLESSDKKALPSVLKYLKLGQFWLHFLLQQQALQQEALLQQYPQDSQLQTSPLQASQTQAPQTQASTLPLSPQEQSADLSAGTFTPAMPAFEKSDIDAALLQLSASLLKENSLQEMVISLVNLLAGYVQATRVSLGLCGRKNLTLEAISFSANFDQRTLAMQAIVDAMAEAVEQGVNIDFSPMLDAAGLQSSEHQPPEHQSPEPRPTEEQPAGNELAGDDAGSPGIIHRAHQQLLQQQHLRAVHTLLLRRGNHIIGALTIELDKQASLDDTQRIFVQQALHFAGAIVALQQQASASVWQSLKGRIARRLSRWFGEDSWRGKLAAVALVIFVVMLFVPVEYRLSADASVQTTEKHWVVAPQDGYLGKVLVRPGDTVAKGTVLAQMNDDDLRLERRKLASQVQQYRQTYDTALANSQRVEAAIASAQMDQASIQLRLVDQQLERTQLVAPMDGMIVSDDISQTQGAPVKQGDLLFEVAATSGFLVRLFVDERDIAAVQVGQQGEVKLTSLPNERFALTVKSITPISEVRDGRNYFRVEAELARESDVLRPGMTGSGKLAVGKRALGWIWFHDLWHWLRLSVW
ncbi:efflux RND transporter periplasmic adaptor subunit [Cellvibrio sp. UBA7661]|uniref:efflux RND transporter periplasmic adaptor subunit n=1 Tax=Cellvibrio sp. UBA7661 TaxID=1946311 RepID=UPI002F35FBBD